MAGKTLTTVEEPERKTKASKERTLKEGVYSANAIEGSQL